MRVLVVLLPFFVGASLADNFNFKKLIPDVDFDNEDCIDGACFLRNQMISIDRSKTDPTTNLAYNEMSLAYVNTQNLLAACLPNADKASVAGSFEKCTGKKMEGVCVFSNRGWLIKDSQNETVANLAFLQTAFSGLAGGDDAVNNCLEIKQEEEVYDDDYFYEYAYDDYDYYDYLEEGEVMEVRRKREAGKGDGGKGSKGGKNEKGVKKGKGRNANKGSGKKGNGVKKGKGRNGKNGGNANAGNNGKGKGKDKKGGNKGKGRNAKKGSEKKGNGVKKGKGRNGKNGGNANAGNNGKGKGKKGGENKGKGKKGNGKNTDGKKPEQKKFVKKDDPSKKPSAENKKKTDKQLGKLGFSKMPNLSTLRGLECIWDSLELLLVKCGEKIISESP